ncbi:helix-turn-helix domain-containing protein [Natrinema versiforme]|uniref:Helix-turn-helix transcriptional regulator n=1 Tax=Natrinema versiforme TaxID=88724 RepID=A0A4V1FYR4_9EURY|nr:helix-turn-helix domain-containing protein [Natrinema versiforme]QCS41415.1 helix-turn-helix transcriptional regulator [Natrinema versiforme]
MARLFPFRSDTAAEEGQPRVVDLEGEDADAVFGALSSTTARQIYSQLDDEPGTPSDIADAVDSSIQNVRYHLENLEDAGLVEVVDTWYSSRGNEMSVYATTDGPLIVTSDESRATQLKEALSRFIGGVGALAGGSLLVQYAMTQWLAPSGTGSTADGGTQPAGTTDDSSGGRTTDETAGDAGTETTDGGDAGAGAADEGDDLSAADIGTSDQNGSESASNGDAGGGGADSGFDADNETLQNATDGGAEAIETVFGSVPPGLLFFLGGLVVLLAITAYWYWYRPSY